MPYMSWNQSIIRTIIKDTDAAAASMNQLLLSVAPKDAPLTDEQRLAATGIAGLIIRAVGDLGIAKTDFEVYNNAHTILLELRELMKVMGGEK